MKLLLVLFAALACAEFNAPFWEKRARASPQAEHSIVLAVAMKDNSAADCDSMLMDISTPGLPNFGKHMSFNEVGERFRNRMAEKQALQLLRRRGILPSEVRMTPHGEFIRVTTTVAKLEHLLQAQFHSYHAVENDKHTIFRDLDWTLPAGLRQYVTFVSDINILPVPPSIARRAVQPLDKTRQSGNVSPQLLNTFYQITTNTVASKKSTSSVFESLGQSFAPSDLTAFQQQYNLPQTPVGQIIGSNQASSCADDVNNCAEASLDVQWLLTVARNANLTFWSVPGNGDIFLQWIEAVSATPNPPLVHSLSYGSLAPEDPKFDVESFNTQLCKLGLKGMTLFVSSGDDGVANFGARGNPSGCGFTPSFPATSPYATSVGATQGPEFGQPEIACSSYTNGLITTGGGFSTYVNRPAWQNTVVHDYLNSGNVNLPPRTMFSSLGRAYPDIAIMGHNYPTTIGGQQYQLSGTSCSSPVAAGMFTLINGARFAAGKGPVGFLNPAIYTQGFAGSKIFNDITSGVNNCCAGNNGTQTCCQYGFTATTGWDPLTGFGTINFKNALAYWGKL